MFLIFIAILLSCSLLLCILFFMEKWNGTYREETFTEESKMSISVNLNGEKREKLFDVSGVLKIVLHIISILWCFFIMSTFANITIRLMAIILIMWRFVCIIRVILLIHKTEDVLEMKSKSFYENFFVQLYKVVFYGLIFLSLI